MSRWPVPRGRGRHVPGVMNKLEREYATHLALRKAAGEISDFWFEGIKLKLADRTYYTPDYLVQFADGTLELHETKGHWEDDARVKVKLAASLFPFRIVAVKKQGSGWAEEAF